MKYTLIAAFVLGLFFVPTGMAATNQGDAYWTFSGMWQQVKEAEGGDSVNIALANLGVEYFLSKAFSMSLEGTGAWTDFADLDLYTVGTRARYHFNTDSDMVPYFGGHASYGYGDSDFGDVYGFVYGPLVGIKFFLNERTNLFVEYQYRIYAGDFDDFLDDSSAVMFGLSFKWG